MAIGQINVTRKENELIIKVKLDDKGKVSGSGKNTVFATTGRNPMDVPGPGDLKLNMSVYGTSK